MKKLFYNGVVYGAPGQAPVGAILIEDERIVALGELEELRAQADENCEEIDLQGRCVIPGLQDSHCHLLYTGMQQENFDLTGVTSLEELIARGRDFIESRKIEAGTWVTGRGFNQNLFKEAILPDKAVADAISTKHNILLDRVCGHMGTLNSMALETLNITTELVIPGGEIAQDNDGTLTGIFYETALEHVKAQIPGPNQEKLAEIVKNACAHANSLGLTSVHSNDVTPATMNDYFEVIAKLEAADELTVRIFEEVHASSLDDLEKFANQPLRSGAGSAYFKIGNIKLFTDGSLGAHSAYLREDYSDQPGNRGIKVFEDANLNAIVAKAAAMDMQVACHAIGDGGILQFIEAIEAAQATLGLKDLRHRVVHCQLAGDDLLERMVAANIASDIQPPFVATDWKVAQTAFGSRADESYRWKTMLDLGIHLGGGSDSPVETISPIWGIHCAVNRTDIADEPAGGWHPEEKLSVEEAVALYTTGPAYLSFEENEKGILAPGFLADFVVLSDDIFKVEPETIKDLKVDMTVVGGNICFRANQDQL